MTCSGAGWAGGAAAAGQCVGVEGWPGQRDRLGWVTEACAEALPTAVGTGRKIEQNKEIQMDRWLVPYVCVRDLLGPPEEGNMLGGRRFKARQPSELVFLTDK